ncbi:MAG: T9SS type A sorting domain-containing protein [Chitinophagaceae bacterium]|nr:T9SS type A sorting domain-containing protein [Chitinophagaceae bacterium]
MKNIVPLPRIALVILLAVFLLTLSSFPGFAQTQSSRPVYQRLYTTLGGYQESLPVDYEKNPTKRYPLLIFLHGSGERGDGSPADLSKLLRNGPFKLINERKFPDKFKVGGKEFSFIVVAPQVTGSSGSNAAIAALISHCLKTYRVDEERIYITGLSLGGLMSYNYVGSKKAAADKIAAALFVCPNANSIEGRAGNIASSNLPVWLTNNDQDNLAKIANAIKTVDMINANNPAPRAKITIFNKTGHDAWSKTYSTGFKENGMNVYEWMLTYTNKRTGTPAPVVVAVPPVVDAGGNKIITLPEDSVVLQGNASATNGAGIKTYEWLYTSGPAAPVIVSSSQKSTAVKKLLQGTYVFTLKATDSNGNSASGSVTITVKPAPVPLTASAGADQVLTMPADNVSLNATGSFAGTGQSIASYLWTRLSGPKNSGNVSKPANAITPLLSLIPGEYAYQLTITDNNGKTMQDTVNVTVHYKAGSLRANAGRDTVLTIAQAKSMILDGSNSTAPAGARMSCGWSRISGPGAHAAVMYPSTNLVTGTATKVAGVYVYQLTIGDEKRNRSKDTVIITVVDTKPSARVAPADNENNMVAAIPATSVNGNDIQLSVWPNPVITAVRIYIEGNATGSGLIKVYDLQGRLVKHSSFVKQPAAHPVITIPAAGLPAGAYILQVEMNGKIQKAIRFIKQ